MCSVVCYKNTMSKQRNITFVFAFSHRRIVFDYTSKISQACGATEKTQASTGRARSPGALFLTVSEGGTKPKKLQIFPLPHKTPHEQALRKINLNVSKIIRCIGEEDTTRSPSESKAIFEGTRRKLRRD